MLLHRVDITLGRCELGVGRALLARALWSLKLFLTSWPQALALTTLRIIARRNTRGNITPWL